MRSAKIILHRKVDCKRECICGSRLKSVGGKFVCERQYQINEPNSVNIYLPEKLPEDNAVYYYLRKIVKKD